MALEKNANASQITIFAGDTGSFVITASRKSGESWTENDRMQMTIKSGDVIMLQRWYRLDDQYDLGDGAMLIEFHNEDTDYWGPGTYSMERRYAVNPSWKTGTAPEGRCVNALTSGNEMISGEVVDTVIQGSFTVKPILGKI